MFFGRISDIVKIPSRALALYDRWVRTAVNEWAGSEVIGNWTFWIRPILD
jgi:hypothetical protein